MGASLEDKQEWKSPYAALLAQTLKPSSRTLRSHKSSQPSDSDQSGFPLPSQEPNSWRLLIVDTRRTDTPIPSQSSESIEVKEDPFQVTPGSVKKLQEDINKVQLTPKKTSKDKI